MLRSSTQLVKSYGYDLGLEYLWNGDEYGSLEKPFESNGEKLRIWRTTRNLSLVHVIEIPVTVHYEDSDKGTVFGKFLLIALE